MPPFGTLGGNVNDTTDHSGKEGIDSIMSAIRRMVRKETRSRVAPSVESAKTVEAADTPQSAETAPEPPAAPSPAAPRRSVLVLQPHMRVDRGQAGQRPPPKPDPAPKPDPKPAEILEEAEKIPHAPPSGPEDSFAIANPVVDEDMLREMVREVVQEQLRGEIGREIIRAMKLDLIRSLEKF